LNVTENKSNTTKKKFHANAFVKLAKQNTTTNELRDEMTMKQRRKEKVMKKGEKCVLYLKLKNENILNIQKKT
jgi:hypothetical protein